MTPARTVGDLVRLGARRTPARIALMMREGRRATYAELEERTERLANALLAHGLERGDRVAAWMEDCVEYVELYLASAKAGLVVVPINALHTAGEAEHVLADSGAAALAWTPAVAAHVGMLGELGERLLQITTGPHHGAGVLGFERLVAGGSSARVPPPREQDLFILGYTSGTTGTPKGAMLTHRSVIAIARQNSASYRLPAGSVAALTGSMSFVATVPAHIITHLYVGGTVIIMGAWTMEDLFETVRAERVTFTYVPSPLIADFTDSAAAEPAAWASLRSVLHSASRAEPAKLRALCEVIGDRFVEGLGMTENSGGLVTATTRADVLGDCDAADVFASVGRAVGGTVVDVVDEQGRSLPRDGRSVGEVVVRSPALMRGYWRQPERTAEVLRDGSYLTGDLGSIDPAGYLYIADRRTDLIVSGGMNVYPSEVERCIARLAGVAECAVVALPHERWGQTVTAVVVLDAAASVSEDAIVEHCRRHLASYKKPTRVLFEKALPRTASLKVKRGAVREAALKRIDAPLVYLPNV